MISDFHGLKTLRMLVSNRIYIFSKLPYGPFEPKTPNNEKNKDENAPHSQRLFLMETQF